MENMYWWSYEEGFIGFVLICVKNRNDNFTFEKYVVSHNPLLSGYVAVIDSVKELENPVHEDVVCHVEAGVEKLPEQFSVHLVQARAGHRARLLQ